MKIATWNVNSLTVRLPQVLEWIQEQSIDILALQELKMPEDQFPHASFQDLGFFTSCLGQKTYNGVAIISRYPISNEVKNFPHFLDPQARVLTVDIENIRLIGAYFPNGQSPDSDKFIYKMQWLNAMHTWCQLQLNENPYTVLLGDFNLTRDSQDVWNPEKMSHGILCTPEERAAFDGFLHMGFIDTVRASQGDASLFSWWDYRDFSFQRNRGMRIDHILISPAMLAGLESAWIDKKPRKNKRPSDHAPVILDWTPPSS